MNNNFQNLLKKSYQFYFFNINNYSYKNFIKLCEFNNNLKFLNTNNIYYKFFMSWFNSNKEAFDNNFIDIIENNNVFIDNLDDIYFYKHLVFGLIYYIIYSKFDIQCKVDNNILFILYN